MTKFYSCLFWILYVHSTAYCCDCDNEYDPYYFPIPDPIEFEGHLWQPSFLIHSTECPCLYEHWDYEMGD